MRFAHHWQIGAAQNHACEHLDTRCLLETAKGFLAATGLQYEAEPGVGEFAAANAAVVVVAAAAESKHGPALVHEPVLALVPLHEPGAVCLIVFAPEHLLARVVLRKGRE